MDNTKYNFLEKEWIDGVARLGATSYRTRIDAVSLTDRMLMDYVLWNHFYDENLSLIHKMRSCQKSDFDLISYVSQLCAPYYSRDVDDFAQNVARVQHQVDVSWRGG